MNTVAAEAVLSALHELEDAHDQWVRLLGNVRRTLRYEDLMPAVERVDQVLGRFVEASQRLRNEVEANRERRPVSALASADERAIAPRHTGAVLQDARAQFESSERNNRMNRDAVATTFANLAKSTALLRGRLADVGTLMPASPACPPPPGGGHRLAHLGLSRRSVPVRPPRSGAGARAYGAIESSPTVR